jgi:hypothetical protein
LVLIYYYHFFSSIEFVVLKEKYYMQISVMN